MLLQCFAVRPDGRDGGALLQHCTPPRMPPRTRTRTIQPAKHQNTQNPRPPQTRSRIQRGRPPGRRRSGGGSSTGRPASRNQRQRKASPDQQEEEEVEQEEQEEEVVEEDTGDPTWTPPEAGESTTMIPLKQHEHKYESDVMMSLPPQTSPTRLRRRRTAWSWTQSPRMHLFMW